MRKNWAFRALALGMALCIFAGGMTFAENVGEGAAAEPAQTTTVEPEGAAAAEPAREGEGVPGATSEDKPAANPEGESSATSEDKPATNPEGESSATSKDESDTLSEDESSAASEDKPAANPEGESSATSEDKPATNPEDKPATNPEDKSAANPEGESSATSAGEPDDVPADVPSDGDGIHLLAEEGEACSHANVDEAWGLRDLIFTVKDENSHIASYYVDTWKYCLDCGAEWDRVEGTQRTEDIEEHRYFNGACASCGYENTCPHANVIDQSGEWGFEYAFKDENSHIVSFYQDTWTQCQDCGDRWNWVDGTERTEETEAHTFSNGVCESCKYENPCLHANLEEDQIEREVQYSNGNADGHTRSYYVDVWYSCPDCGENWLVKADEKTVVQEEHSWSNGACLLCEYSCEHENVRINTQWENASYAQKDGENHIVRGIRWDDFDCPTCRKSWREGSETEVEAEQAHDFEAGKCMRCNYVCQHPQVRQEEAIVVKYSAGDADGHTKTSYNATRNICEVCGDQWDDVGEALRDVSERHSYHGWYGICIKCGYECPHARVLLVDSWYEGAQYEEGDAEGHVVRGYRGNYYTCLDCGIFYGERETEISTAREGHSFRDGACYVCGYQNACTHEDMIKTPSGWEEATWSDPTPYDHAVTGYRWVRSDCWKCGEVTYKRDDQLSSEREDHSFDPDGRCKCGYEIVCPHEDLNVWKSWSNATYGESNDEGHTRTGECTVHSRCNNCGKEWQETGTEAVSEREPHNYWNGVCQNCGYENFCPHENVSVERTWEAIDIGDVTDPTEEGHVVKGYYWDQFECPDCGEVWGQRGYAQEPVRVEHLYNEGVCKMCGYACPHPQAEVIWSRAQGETSYAPVDAANHSASTEMMLRKECPACEHAYTTTEIVTETRAHAFANGVCADCGYVCAHQQAAKEDILLIEYANGDADGHTKTGSNATHNICEVCGVAWDDVGEMFRDVKERHDFNGGICTKCGYECTHARTVPGETRYEVVNCEEGDAEGHIVSGYRRNGFICLDCRRYIEEKETEISTARESHSFEDGECVVCGYQIACTHENALEWASGWKEAKWSDPTPYDHAVTGYRWMEYYCKNCGGWLFERDDALSSGREDHSFDEDGRCKCGYEITCSHENSESWEDWSNVTYGEINDEGHARTGVRTVYSYCNDCGKEWEETGTEAVTVREPHNYDSGVCQDCGYQNFCPHENVSVERIWATMNIGEVTDPTEEGHVVKGYYWDRFECRDCGEGWGQRGYAQEPVRVEHLYNEGVCKMCGYACPHPQAEVIWSRAQGETSYAPVDAANHSASTEMMLRKVCSSCGHAYTTTEIVTETRPHSFVDGVCADCGYACAHQQAEKVDLLLIEYSEGDADGHIKTGYNATHNICADCGYAWDEVTGEAICSVKERHFFRGEICSRCGYECQHTRTMPEEAWFEDAVYEEGDAEGHIVSGYRWNGYTCLDCGKYAEEKEAGISTAREYHRFKNGKCLVCGYQNACTHEGAMEWSSGWEEAKWSDPTPYDHAVTGYRWKGCYCWKCGEWMVISDDAPSSGREDHSFGEDGRCKCGYEIVCPHADLSVQESWSDAIFSEINDEGHTRTGVRTVQYRCNHCGKEWQETGTEAVTVREPHDYYNGYCRDCGHQSFCPHENVSFERIWETVDEGDIADPTQEGHAVKGQYWDRFECQDCGENWGRRGYAQEPTLVEHRYYKGVCLGCGYTCAHTQAEVIWSRALGATSYAPKDAANHSASTEMMLRKECPGCAYAYTTTEIVTETRAHTFVKGVCADCGYVAPAPTAEPTPIPTPEPVFEEIPAAEAVHGVKVEDAMPMVETMMTVADALEAEIEAVTVQIVNVEKVLTAEEREALEQLSVKEQLLTFLSVIGFEAQVNAAMEASESSFSPEAEALKTQIQARIEAMDEAAREEFEAALRESFPREVVVIDGVEYNFFVLEIEVRVGDSVRYERYGFRREGDEWIFTRLEIGE